MHLQEPVMGQPAQMRLDGNDDGLWVPNEVPGKTGIDPDSVGQDDPLGVLRQVRGLGDYGYQLYPGEDQ